MFWATFATKLVANKFQNSSNLVTLILGKSISTFSMQYVWEAEQSVQLS